MHIRGNARYAALLLSASCALLAVSHPQWAAELVTKGRYQPPGPGKTEPVVEAPYYVQLKRQLDALPTGQREFNPPATMVEGINTRVEFRISRG
jgi:hypothetical protein